MTVHVSKLRVPLQLPLVWPVGSQGPGRGLAGNGFAKPMRGMLSDADAQNASPQNLVMVMPPPMHDDCSLAGYVKYTQEVTSAARQSESRLGELLSLAICSFTFLVL
jgi:hypothetical protein